MIVYVITGVIYRFEPCDLQYLSSIACKRKQQFHAKNIPHAKGLDHRVLSAISGACIAYSHAPGWFDVHVRRIFLYALALGFALFTLLRVVNFLLSV